MDKETRKYVVAGLGTLLGLLLSGNIFFIVRLVDRIEKTSDLVYELRQEVVILKMSFETYTHKKIGGG